MDFEVELRCPACKSAAGRITPVPAGALTCQVCGFRFEHQNGILCALPGQRRQVYARFIEEYSKIRELEGRGSDDAAYYLALPFKDLTGRNSGQWMIRGRTYRFFERRVLPQFENAARLSVLDLGAGTGWLSNRLAKRRHRPVAVDILVDTRDGLGAAHHYRKDLDTLFPLIMAEFDDLPFADAQFDLAIFNSSLHYSTDYFKTLRETRRCLKPDGKVVVLDSPIYRRREYGEQMREERHSYFEKHFGFRSDSIPSVEFLDDDLLRELARHMGLKWKVYRPWYGWRWRLRPLRAWIKRSRPPSRFQILVGSWTT